MLAKLDTEEWEDELSALEDQVTVAERQFTTEERDLIQAQVNLLTPEDNLYDIEEVQEAQDAIDDAEYDLKIAQAMWEEAIKSEPSGGAPDYWRNEIKKGKRFLSR